MRLIKLSSNMNSFHDIEFKKGLNIIVGRQANPNNSNKKDTYNGVGKSLIIYIVHFCLGSNKIKPFEEKIPGWEFRLDVEINGVKYTLSRNTSKQNQLFINDEKFNLTGFRNELLPKVFNLDQPRKNLTFNTLFPRFIRRDRECYSQYDTFIKNERDYSKLLNISFLLGLDIDLIEQKKQTRDEQKSAEDLSGKLETDPVLKDYFTNKDDFDIEILDTKEEIKKLEAEIEKLNIAENYHDIEKKADEAKFRKRQLENKRVLLQNAIRGIEKSLQLKPDMSLEKVMELYDSAKEEFPDMVIKNVEQTVKFHDELLNSRQNRLHKELNKNRIKVKNIEKEINELGKEINNFIAYLDTHKALDEYMSINQKLQSLKIHYEKLINYQDILKNYRKKLRELQNDFTNYNQLTDEYLDGITELQQRILQTFRELSREFYDKPGGIKIENNEGENTLRYNITAKIQDDSSDGVSEVKIFCFDLTLLLLQLNHSMKFVFHDSRLLSNMDPRQRYTLFKQSYEKTLDNDLQYIVSANEDVLLSFRDLMSKDDYKKIITDNIRLELTDDSDESKLLGVQVDMDYDK
ncbi:DUF2326 domain-containing protein [Lentibacillus lipolyticus]|nr:DUF2326 domain-containing protein [Lentibacillus lipolyticus]